MKDENLQQSMGLMRSDQHILRHGAFELTLCPGEGALIRQMRWRNSAGQMHDLTRPAFAEGDRPGAPRRFGLWPLVPFANRAFGGVIHDGRTQFQLPLNDPATGSAIHGFGWEAIWHVSQATPASLTMVHERQAKTDPYHYSATMCVVIRDGSVRITLSVTHLGKQALPYGLGLHPWFLAQADTMLAMSAESELVFGEGYRAKGLRQLEGGGPYAASKKFRSQHEVAHSFVNWSGDARITTPSTGLGVAITASPSLNHPVVWAPSAADFLCLEPQSHAIGATSEKAAREATPLSSLEYGETLSGWMEIRPFEL